MKGRGKKTTGSEESDEAADCNADHEVNDPLAPSGETYQIQNHLVDVQGRDSEGEATEAEEGGEVEDKEDGDTGAEQAEGFKLDEGFYEIEAIRRKRVRKGQLQYLIKWRGWPETANTWEPLENLQSCSDFIDAFEESLRSGKQRKRKRKHVVVHSQPKKSKQSSSTASYSVKRVRTSTMNKDLSSALLSDLAPTGFPSFPQTLVSVGEAEHKTDAVNHGKVRQAYQNGYADVSHQIDRRKEENEYDPKLRELKVMTPTSGVEADKLTNHPQETKTSEANGHVNGQVKYDCKESNQSSSCRGSKRRKCGSVKRFKKEQYLSEPVDIQNAARISDSGGTVEQSQTEIPEFGGNCSAHKHKTDDSKNLPSIIKIIKPIGYSASMSSNLQDVLVTFMAMRTLEIPLDRIPEAILSWLCIEKSRHGRSDGIEVITDNKFLKASDPLLLINFYEQHLRYSPAS